MSALKKLHEDFHWPLPILSLSALRHISSGTANFYLDVLLKFCMDVSLNFHLDMTEICSWM